MKVATLIQLDFEPACTMWLESRRIFLSANSCRQYGRCIHTLAKWFGNFKLPEIDGDMLRTFQHERRKQCGPNSINKEAGLLVQIRKSIGLPIPDYRPIPNYTVPIGRALLPEERERLFRLAKRRPGWQAVYLFAKLSINTSGGPKEILSLRLADVDPFDQGTILIRGTKNIHRVRTVPLNKEGLEAVIEALERARRLGSTEPDHYLFPFPVGGDWRNQRYDPTRHQSTVNRSWYELRRAAALPNIRLYDLRHHVITAMCEDPTCTEQTIRDIAGHVNSKMLAKYSHIRMDAKRKALEHTLERQVERMTKKPPQPTEGSEAAMHLAGVLAKLLENNKPNA